MKKLKTIVRMRKLRLDEARRELQDLTAMQADIENRLAVLESEIEAEREIASRTGTEPAFVPYLARAMERRETLQKSYDEIAAHIATTQEKVALQFRETKKYEQFEEENERRHKISLERREQASNDAAALAGFVHHRQH